MASDRPESPTSHKENTFTDSEDEEQGVLEHKQPRGPATPVQSVPVPGFTFSFQPSVIERTTELSYKNVTSVSHVEDAHREKGGKDTNGQKISVTQNKDHRENTDTNPDVAADDHRPRASANVGRPLKNIDFERIKAWIREQWTLESQDFLFPEVDHELQSQNPYLPKARDIYGGGKSLMPCSRYLHRHASTITGPGMDATFTSELKRTTTNLPMVYLAKNAKDLSSMLESSDNMVDTMYIPCTHCYAGQQAIGSIGGEGQRGPGSIMGPYGGEYGDEYMPRRSMPSEAGICPSCRSKRMSLGDYAKMLSQLKKLMKEKDLVTHDVYPDGNCQLTAVIDQLHVRGNFRFTISSLRQKAVEFLRNNPMADEETHYEQFVPGEPWEAYLTRMSQEHQWGDHLMLNAICNVINMRIQVFGGFSGETKTVLLPNTAKRSKESTDDETSTESDLPTIYLGHIGESHYISLRPRTWRTKLMAEADKLLDDWKNRGNQSVIVSIFHIDLTVRMILRLQYIAPAKPNGEMLPFCHKETDTFISDLVGPVISCIEPVVDTIIGVMSSQETFFSTDSQSKSEKKKSILIFKTPTDTYVRKTLEHAKNLDLALGRNASGIGKDLFRLYPKKPNLWKGQTAIDSEDCKYLTSYGAFVDVLWVRGDFEECSAHEVLAFQCEWPECANGWKRRKPTNPICNEPLKGSILEHGCRVIPVMDKHALTDVTDFTFNIEEKGDNGLWCYSFAVAERQLCLEALSVYHREAFLLFRLLILEYVEDTVPMPLSVLKSAFFYTCEQLTSDYWHSQPGYCVMIMLKKLVDGLRGRCIPHYFISGFNLLSSIPDEHIDTWQSCLGRVEENFILHLYWLLDLTGLSECELGSFVEGIIEECIMYSEHGNILQSAQMTIGPLFISLLCSFHNQFAFRRELQVLDEATDLLRLYGLESRTIESSFRRLVGGAPVKTRYEIALYVDMCRNTTLTREVCADMDFVPLEDILGPDLPKALRGKIAPAENSIICGELGFGVVLFRMLVERQEPTTVIAKCIRFYVDTYANLAGDNIVIDFGDSEQHVLQYRQWHMHCLYSLYRQLFFLYAKMKTPEAIRPLMNVFMLLCNHLGRPGHLKTLQWAWDQLGEHGRSDVVK